MYDGSALAAVELRFREDLWLTAPSDAIEEAEVRRHRLGPILVTVFGELPDIRLMNLVQGVAEPGAIAGGYMADAIEWVRSWEVDYRVLVSEDRPGTKEAEDWLAGRGYVRQPTRVRRFQRSAAGDPDLSTKVKIRELGALETEGMSHIFAKSLGLPGLATVVLFGLPEQPGWHCYSARLEDREVACGSMLVYGKLALFALDATLPNARNQGCQSALIARRLVEAERAGCETVYAEVCDDFPDGDTATDNLTRAGFVEIPGGRHWGRPTGIG
jgi:GNAT superfamily N-acetyltransferase